jgi:hypothetical protein
MSEGSIGESFEITIEWLLQFIFMIDPFMATVPSSDIKAFLLLNSLDASFLSDLCNEVISFINNKWVSSAKNVERIS